MDKTKRKRVCVCRPSAMTLLTALKLFKRNPLSLRDALLSCRRWSHIVGTLFLDSSFALLAFPRFLLTAFDLFCSPLHCLCSLRLLASPIGSFSTWHFTA